MRLNRQLVHTCSGLDDAEAVRQLDTKQVMEIALLPEQQVMICVCAVQITTALDNDKPARRCPELREHSGCSVIFRTCVCSQLNDHLIQHMYSICTGMLQQPRLFAWRSRDTCNVLPPCQ